MFEIILIIIFGVVFIMYPIRKGGISAAYNDPHNLTVMAATAILLYVIYSVYSYIKSKRNKK